MKTLPQGTTPAYQTARLVIALAGGLLGYAAAEGLLTLGWLQGAINIAYIVALGLLTGYLIGGTAAERTERRWLAFLERAKRIPPDAILAAGVGATVALLITVLLNSVLERVPGFTWYLSLLITTGLVVASSWFFVANRKTFFRNATQTLQPPTVPQRHAAGPKLVDTSAIIDGRILDVLESNFLEGTLLIPQFVLQELQRIADSDEPLRRRRGRRGLEVLDRLAELKNVESEVVTRDYDDTRDVDTKLVRLCQERTASLITTDYNLNRVAALQGIRVLNVNQLANAVKATYLPGERLSLNIVKAGREPGQGLAYLEDGTMIVVEDAAGLVGRTVDAVVTSNLQTNMGRMIFAKLDSETPIPTTA